MALVACVAVSTCLGESEHCLLVSFSISAVDGAPEEVFGESGFIVGISVVTKNPTVVSKPSESDLFWLYRKQRNGQKKLDIFGLR